jgi:hypothetical protein
MLTAKSDEGPAPVDDAKMTPELKLAQGTEVADLFSLAFDEVN